MKPALVTFAAAVMAVALFLLFRGASSTGCGRGCAHQARAAHAFVASLGVNVHLSYADTPNYAYSQVKAKLRELGVRHVRDALKLDRPDAWSRAEDLAKTAGVKTLFIAGEPLGRFGAPANVRQALAMLKGDTPRAVEAVEGPNEYDASGDPGWPRSLRAWATQLWTAAKADQFFARTPVLGPSVSRRESYSRVGDLTPYVDAGSLHPYPGGLSPQRTGGGSIEQSLADSYPTYGRKPLWITETGYHNAVRCSDCGHQPATERAAGAYVGRMVLDYFRRGIPRTYLYELVDLRPDPEKDEPEKNFGLYRSDWSSKPAARHIAHLVELLADPGPALEPGTLRYELTADDGQSTIRQLLLEKRDCTFWLALWQEEPLYDPASRKDLFPASVPFRIRLGTPVEEVVEYHPSHSTTPLAVHRGSTITGMEVPADDETLLRIRPESCEGRGAR